MDNTTIDSVIAEADALEPNAWSRAEKIRCISRLDGQLWNRYCKGRAGAQERMLIYTEDSPGDTALLAQHPYDGIYIHWLIAHIALYLGENDRYNDLMAKFADEEANFAEGYAADHPRAGGTRFLF